MASAPAAHLRVPADTGGHRGTSVIVASYNQPNALALVLEGVLAQEEPIAEMVIADDGSEPDTAELVHEFRARTAIPILFTTQEDRGFRKAKALNNAIRQSRGELLLFLDGDCIPPPGWATRFVTALRAGADFATAGYVMMDLERTRARTRAEAASGAIARVVTDAERAAFRLMQRKERLYSLLRKRKKPRILGGNWAVTRAALVAVNGFDERFEGVAKEDSDVRNRLRNAGFRGVPLWDSNWVFHCSHDLDPRRTRPEVLRRPGVEDYYVTRARSVICEEGLVRRAQEA